jgi:8-oxo-dGTP pyrophosphatase MutT (NUDIX family)
MTISADWHAGGVPYQLELVQQALTLSSPPAPSKLVAVREMDGTVAVRQPTNGALPRQSAVLLLLYPHQEQLWLPLTVRSHTLARHRGEVSLPGGSADPADPDLVTTALRETQEELGIATTTICVLGNLTPFYIPASNFELLPVVGYIGQLPPLVPNPAEVAQVLHIPLALLADRRIVQQEVWQLHERQMRVEYFAIQGYKVWGATALLLSELIARVQRVAGSLHPDRNEASF